MHDHKSLVEIHEDVPADHYDKGIRRNLFQRYWHSSRFREVLKILKPVDGPILDIGCHSGTFTKIIADKIRAKSVYGIDISPAAIELASTRIPEGNFQAADAQHLPFKNDFFDAVFCLEVLEHVDNPREVIKEIKRVLKNGGFAVLLVPTDNKLFKVIWFLWTLYYPVWRHAHVQSFSGGKLENMIEEIGLRITATKSFNLGMLKLVMAEK